MGTRPRFAGCWLTVLLLLPVLLLTPKAITSGFFFHAARKDPQEGYK
jgi:hypothetical protein